MQAMILTAPPHLLQTETSILKTRLSLSAHVSVSLYENIRLFATKHKIHRIRRGWSYAKNV